MVLSSCVNVQPASGPMSTPFRLVDLPVSNDVHLLIFRQLRNPFPRIWTQSRNSLSQINLQICEKRVKHRPKRVLVQVGQRQQSCQTAVVNNKHGILNGDSFKCLLKFQMPASNSILVIAGSSGESGAPAAGHYSRIRGTDGSGNIKNRCMFEVVLLQNHDDLLSPQAPDAPTRTSSEVSSGAEAGSRS